MRVVTLLVAIAVKAVFGGGGSDTFTYVYVMEDGREWRYSLSDDKATLLSAPAALNGVLDIPERFGQHPVVAIASSAFAGRGDIVRLTMPDTIQTIGPCAFQDCTNMMQISISTSTSTIGYWAFKNCSSLTDLTIPDSVQTMGAGVLGGCSGLRRLSVPFVGECRGNDGWDVWDKGCFVYIFAGVDDGMYKVPQIWSINSSSHGLPTNLVAVAITDETVIGVNAFASCSKIEKLSIAGSVTKIRSQAFKYCESLKQIYFYGDAPKKEYDVFLGVSNECVFAVPYGSTGWGVDIPGTWNGVRIEYIDAGAELPDVETDDEAKAAVAEFADARIAEYITTKAEYDAFREWARALKGTGDSASMTEAVKASGTAWVSFALDAAAVVPTPKDGDLVIDAVSVSSGGAAEAVFALDGVRVGTAAAEARLKTIFGVEGAATLEDGAFSSDNLDFSLTPTGDGRIKTVVAPHENAAGTFFLRVKMK